MQFSFLDLQKGTNRFYQLFNSTIYKLILSSINSIFLHKCAHLSLQQPILRPSAPVARCTSAPRQCLARLSPARPLALADRLAAATDSLWLVRLWPLRGCTGAWRGAGRWPPGPLVASAAAGWLAARRAVDGRWRCWSPLVWGSGEGRAGGWEWVGDWGTRSGRGIRSGSGLLPRWAWRWAVGGKKRKLGLWASLVARQATSGRGRSEKGSVDLCFELILREINSIPSIYALDIYNFFCKKKWVFAGIPYHQP